VSVGVGEQRSNDDNEEGNGMGGMLICFYVL